MKSRMTTLEARFRPTLMAFVAGLGIACQPDPCSGDACVGGSETGSTGASATGTSGLTTGLATGLATGLTTAGATVAETTTGASSTGGDGTSEGSTSETGDGSTTEAPSICGDGIVQGDEECDDGEDNVDGVYGACTLECLFGQRCGDGVINGGEACDDKNNGDPSDGCLDGCVEPRSCLEIKLAADDAPSGIYRLWPKEGIGDVKAWCEMDADAGGYTILKVHTVDGQGNDVEQTAKAAEAICASYGMHLFAPRSSTHLKAAFAVAVGDELAPVGGGDGIAGPEYLEILSIYPNTLGNSCAKTPFNSESCPGWSAGHGEVYWVSDIAMFSQPSANNCIGCSMEYSWTANGTVDSFIALAFGGEGFAAPRFLCEVGDKLP